MEPIKIFKFFCWMKSFALNFVSWLIQYILIFLYVFMSTTKLIFVLPVLLMSNDSVIHNKQLRNHTSFISRQSFLCVCALFESKSYLISLFKEFRVMKSEFNLGRIFSCITIFLWHKNRLFWSHTDGNLVSMKIFSYHWPVALSSMA